MNAARPLFRCAALLAGAPLAAGLPSAQEAAGAMRDVADDTRVERSCRVELPGSWLRDEGAEGVLEVAGDGITVEFTGELRGSPPDATPDTFRGVGLRVTGKNVTLRGARVSGFRVGILAIEADGLRLEDCDVSGNFRQRLRSTPEKEAEEDWLQPHANDERQWVTNYGAGICIERSRDVRVERCRARAGQNGLVLDRCEGCTVVGNDFSFLSGWGIALWRSSDNRLLDNDCDFCIRGYSHGVYNRGQDSAGILLFEQCSRNVIAGNSADYCGDGLFAFAGQEALGSAPPPAADFDPAGRGDNENLVFGNDFSFAAAHGLELTFSFGNRILKNRFEGNAICGIWGGYSRDTLIAANDFVRNGDAGYGLERGGVNIEHGQRNRIVNNTFQDNACGVHLWWDEDTGLAELPWCRANGAESLDNCVQGNTFERDRLALELRDTKGTRTWANTWRVEPEAGCRATPGSEPVEEECFAGAPPEPALPVRNPTGRLLPGRERIRIDEWGPVEPER